MNNNDQILALLESSDPESIREGAHLAGEHRLAAAIPALVNSIASPNIGVQEAVDRALRKIGGPEVVEAVIPILRSEDTPSRNLAMDLLRHLGACDIKSLAALLVGEDPDVRIFAADILGSVDSGLAVAPLCHALLQDPEVNVRYQAAVSLGTLNRPEAVPCLNNALKDEEWVQFSAIEALTKLKAESSIGPMIAAFERASDLIASTIVDALGEMGNIKAVPLLLKRLPNAPTPLANKIVRAIINILGEKSLTLLGTKDCERLRNHMLAALKDEDIEVQDAAIRGFAALGGEDATANILQLATKLNPDRDADRLDFMIGSLIKVGMNATLEKALLDENEHTVAIGMSAIHHIENVDLAPFLKKVFWDKSRNIQRSMIYQLAKDATAADEDFFLDIIAKHEDGNVLREALEFLGTKGNPQTVQGPVISMLTHPYDDVKEAALNAAIALHTPTIEQHFQKQTTSDDPVQRMIAIYALGTFDARKFFTELQTALEDEASDVRRVAVEMFNNSSPLSQELISLVEQRLFDESSDVRMAAVETLSNTPGKQTDLCLAEGLLDRDPWVRVRCIEKLGARQSTENVSKIIDLLNDSNNLIVIKAIEALGKIGGETSFRSLLPLLAHSDADVQQAAEEAVEIIRNQTGA